MNLQHKFKELTTRLLNQNKYYYSIIISLFFVNCFSQVSINSEYLIIRETYDQFVKKNKLDSARYYVNMYLNKAKSEKNFKNLIHGHYFSAEFGPFKVRMAHLDSIISLSSTTRAYQIYPAHGHLLKGQLYYSIKDYSNALDSFLSCLETATKNGNEYHVSTANQSIGLIKLERVGKEKEALELLNNSLGFYNTQHKIKKYRDEYLALLFSKVKVFIRLKQQDSSKVYIDLGLKESLKTNNYLYDYFVYADGIHDFENQRFIIAKNKLLKSKISMTNFHDYSNLSLLNYYLGKIEFAFGNKEKGIEYLFVMDSISDIHPFYSDRLRDGIIDIIDNFKSEGVLNKELHYVKKLIKLDSMYINDYKELSNQMTLKYDQNKLIDIRLKLENKLNYSESNLGRTKNILISIIIISILFFAALFVYFDKKQQEVNRKFKKLMNNNFQSDDKKLKKSRLELNDNIVIGILNRLLQFENDFGFLQNDLDAYKLSKLLNTNYKYLSKVINAEKNKSIVNYINELRIDFGIEKLKSDPKFRLYKSQVIAEECGFSTIRPFFSAFEKRTKMKFSLFLKELKKTSKS